MSDELPRLSFNVHSFEVRPEMIDLGCISADDRLDQYTLTEEVDSWQQCRNECFLRTMKVFISPT